ncbi:hypothetical protein [Saccharopolyspora taberi]|uniref:DUF3558 domain-containing protein n=1 Tax=Saccharopolyspora taberi TaxID=60895 RepID=A0ABN3VJ30_9PSEU
MPRLTANTRTPILLIAVFLLASCSGRAPAEPGYRELPNPCQLVGPPSAADLVGPAESELSGFDEPDPEAKSTSTSQACVWDSRAAPGWGEIVLVNLRVQVTIHLLQDGSPAVEPAKDSSQLQEHSMQAAPPPLALGDQSFVRYTDQSGVQTSSFYFRKANVEVTVHYRGQGENFTGAEVNKPREELENAVHGVAAEALEKLGPPK